MKLALVVQKADDMRSSSLKRLFSLVLCLALITSACTVGLGHESAAVDSVGSRDLSAKQITVNGRVAHVVNEANGILKDVQDDKYYRVDQKAGYVEVAKTPLISSAGSEVDASALLSLRDETREVVESIMNNSKTDLSYELESIAVYTDVISRASTSNQYVQNEQIVYNASSDFRDWFTYWDNLDELAWNVFTIVAFDAAGNIPILGDYVGYMGDILDLSAATQWWTETKTQISLHETKIIQLSWVYNPGVSYPSLGAQTQAATVCTETLTQHITAPPFQKSEVVIGPEVYFETDNFQYPDDIAISYSYYETYVERLTNYSIETYIDGGYCACDFSSHAL